MAKKDIIKAENIKVRYGDATILENVNMSVDEGEIFVIVGGSGSGKSTLLRQLIGLEYPNEGSVYIDGKNFTEAEGKERKKILQKFGVMFQLSGLFASMTIGQNIKLVLDTYTDLSERRKQEIIDLKLRSVGLAGYQDHIPSELSGGMKKRASLARAMALDPVILFFDEPSSGLDPITSASLDELILEINRAMKTTMVVISHDLESILRISDKIIMLDKEKRGIIARGTPDELRNYKDNEQVYKFFNRISNR